jgi:thiol-disulfide isomerase/thioredoxin
VSVRLEPTRGRQGSRAVVAATVLALAATSLDTPTPRVSHATTEPPASLLLQPFAEPLPIPDVTLTDLDGRALGAAQLRGKTVLLNFWATWCLPCRAEMPALEMLHRGFRHREFLVLAVNFKEASPDVRRFVQNLNVSFPVALDVDGSLSRALQVRGLPVSFLLDPGGKLLWKAIGAREWNGAEGRAYLDRLLPAPRS